MIFWKSKLGLSTRRENVGINFSGIKKNSFIFVKYTSLLRYCNIENFYKNISMKTTDSILDISYSITCLLLNFLLAKRLKFNRGGTYS